MIEMIGWAAVSDRIDLVRSEVKIAVRHARPGPTVQLVWLGLALALAIASGFAAGYDKFAGDLWLTKQVQALEIDGLSRTAQFATDLVSPTASAVGFVGVVGALLLLGRVRLAIFMAAAAWAHLIGGLLKLFVDRPRPSVELVETVGLNSEFSYPSGHTDWAVGFEGFLVFALWQLTPNPFVRAATTAGWALHIMLIGFGRVDQGVHWPSDILGGFLVGALALSITVWAYLESKRLARR